MIDVDTILTFGKHKGEQFEDVCHDDPNYVAWLAANTDNDFSEEAYELMSKLKII